MSDNNLENEPSEWMFPAIDIWDPVDDIQPEPEEKPAEEVVEEELVEVAQVSEKELEQDRLFAEKMTQLEDQKKDFLNKIGILNKIFEELKSSPISIDEEIIGLIDHVVKKAVKKIIIKEMQADQNILPQMITQLKGLIEEKNSVLNIYICQEDYQLIMQDNLLPPELLSVNSALSHGDIIVKSNFSEISAILDERIAALTKVDHV